MIRVSVWHGGIKPKDRNSRTISDGAIFNHEEDARKFQMRVLLNGGAIAALNEFEGNHGYESLEEFDSIGRMSSDELRVLKLKMEKGR